MNDKYPCAISKNVNGTQCSGTGVHASLSFTATQTHTYIYAYTCTHIYWKRAKGGCYFNLLFKTIINLLFKYCVYNLLFSRRVVYY